MTKYVMAGNYREFISWCLENGFNSNDTDQAIFLSHPDDLRGRRMEIIRYGNWIHNPCAFDPYLVEAEIIDKNK